MSLVVGCPKCACPCKVPAMAMGKTVKCPRCAAPFAVPSAMGTASPSPQLMTKDKTVSPGIEKEPAGAATREGQRSPVLLVALGCVALLALAAAAGGGGLLAWFLLPRAAPSSGTAVTPVASSTDEAKQAQQGPSAEEVKAQRELQAARRRSQKNLKELALAFQNYNDAHGRCPPAMSVGWPRLPANKQPDRPQPLLSWRVFLLPFIEEGELYKEFKLDEPWDSPHNEKLLARMPMLYAPVRGTTPEPGMTYYQVFVGDNTPFLPAEQLIPLPQGAPLGAVPQGGPRIPASIADGTSNTLLIVEAGEPVPWTKPADLPYDAKKPLPRLGGLFADGFHAAAFDAAVYFIPRDFKEKDLRCMITPSDGDGFESDLKPLPAKDEAPPADTSPNDRAKEKEKEPAPGEAAKKEETLRKREPPLFRGKTAEAWLKQLQLERGNPVARREAIKGLAEVIAEARKGRGVPELAPAALQAVCGATTDADATVAQEALESLGLTGPRDKEAAIALLKPFPGQGTIKDFRWWPIIDLLNRVGPKLVPSLLQALNDDDYEVRALADAALQSFPGGGKMDPIPEAVNARWRRLWDWYYSGKPELEAAEKVLRLLEGLHDKRANDAVLGLKQAGPLGRVAIPELFRAHPLPAAQIGSPTHGILASPDTPLPKREHLPPEIEKHSELLEALAQNKDIHRRLGPKAIPELLVLLRLPDRRIPHETVVWALGQYGPAARDALPALRVLLEQSEAGIRAQTMQVARRFSPVCLMVGQAGTSPLAVVADVHWMVGEYQARADNRIVEQDRREHHPDPLEWTYSPNAHFEIVRALFHIDPGSRATLRPVLKSWLRSGGPWLALNAALLLATDNVVDRDTFEVLLQSYGGQGGWQPSLYEVEQGAKEMSQLPPQAQKALLAFGRPALKSADARTRRQAAWMLAPFDPDACVPVLVEALKTEDPRILIPSEQTLAFLGPRARMAFAALRARLEQAQKTRFVHYDTVSEAHSLPAALARVDPDAAIPLLVEVWRAKPAKPQQWWQSPSAGAFDELKRLAPRLQTAIPAVIDELKSPQGYGSEAEQLLARIGQPALPPLRAAARLADPTCRARAAHALAQLAGNAKAALPDLLKLLADRDANVRREAVRALGQIDPGNDKAMAAVVRMRKDADEGVRHQVVRALGGMGPSAVPILAEVVAESDGAARLTAVAALGRLGAPGAPSLRGALQHKDVQVRRLAVLALGHPGPDTPGAIAALLEATRDRDPLTRRLAVSLLDRPGRESEQVLPVLAKAVSDEDPAVRWTAVFVLEELSAKDAHSVSALAQALTDRDRDVRRRALFALAAIGRDAQSAIPAVKKMLLEDEALHAEAVSTLLRLSASPAAPRPKP